MTDRELLEQAAKAAGIEGDSLGSGIRTYEAPHHSPELDEFWNPLTDDGDALRLAVKLGLWINAYEYSIEAVKPPQRNDERRFLREESYGDDPYAATRRAIVRAAAEIGKGMK